MKDTREFQTIRVEVEDALGRLTLNRPERLNAVGATMLQELAEAARWFERAANLGDVDSQFDLAILYERGEGVPRNLTEAYKWYSIAAKQDDRDAIARAATVGAQLLPAYLREASAAAKGFQPSLASRAANDIPALAPAR